MESGGAGEKNAIDPPWPSGKFRFVFAITKNGGGTGPCSTFAEFELSSTSTAGLSRPQRTFKQRGSERCFVASRGTEAV